MNGWRGLGICWCSICSMGRWTLTEYANQHIRMNAWVHAGWMDEGRNDYMKAIFSWVDEWMDVSMDEWIAMSVTIALHARQEYETGCSGKVCKIAFTCTLFEACLVNAVKFEVGPEPIRVWSNPCMQGSYDIAYKGILAIYTAVNGIIESSGK